MSPPPGRYVRGIRRGLIAAGGKALSTRELLAWCDPRGAKSITLRDRRNRCRAIRRAAAKLLRVPDCFVAAVVGAFRAASVGGQKGRVLPRTQLDISIPCKSHSVSAHVFIHARGVVRPAKSGLAASRCHAPRARLAAA
jgi:hypothetical protein